METIYLKFDELHDLVSDVLMAGGLSEKHAKAISKVVVEAERDQCKSHGIYRITGIINTLRHGVAKGDVDPEVYSHASKATVVVNAKGGFSPLAFEEGLEVFVEKTTKYGLAAMAIRDCVHFSALWPEVERLADKGLIALAMCPSNAYVAPFGGIRKLLGTNPLAFAWPCTGGMPYVFDFATSVVARGEVELYRLRNEALPDGWGIDKNGSPTNNPESVLSGALLTFGGYKGSAIATMIELLAGVLIGDLLSIESSALDNGRLLAPRHGELLIAIDPKIFDVDDLENHTKKLLDEFKSQGARIPSQRRYRERLSSLKQGIPVSYSNFEKLQKMKLGDFEQNLF
ncbi:Ldh family oxidoreductase [Pelistega suis]|uniref:Ldh family oxidoreductase n=1 Tax=Pelistega suis TaxID=1631957 RepID=UPI00211B7992|nr:Ldh family oxidoreductase [Pelistega suis]MCQ9329587.1 Ldh family oxidoreductase [Pelistega suis]